MPKVVKTSETPNPQARKFHLDCRILAHGSRSFADAAEAAGDELAAALFDIPAVTSVFYFGSVVSVSKTPKPSWDDLIVPIADLIEEHVVEVSEPVGVGKATGRDSPEIEERDPGDIYPPEAPENFLEMPYEGQMAHINRILDTLVRPGLAGDGGGLALLAIEGKRVLVHYQGACGSCPSSMVGTLQFIETALRERAHPGLSVVAE